jgi:hypothetical protein
MNQDRVPGNARKLLWPAALVYTAKLSMFNQNKATLIDVDNVALLDDTGRNLVRNGDFQRACSDGFFLPTAVSPGMAKTFSFMSCSSKAWVHLSRCWRPPA